MPVTERYTAVAILLHWAIAVAIIGNLLLGWWMHDAIDAAATQARAVIAFQLHKSIGLTVLVLSILRLLWRLAYPAPALPMASPRWERRVAKVTHVLFYVLMIGIPLSGWVYVSTQWRGDNPLNIPTLWFGLFEIPHLFALHDAAQDVRQSWAGIASEFHELLAGGMLMLLCLHIGAALKHHFVDRDSVLAGMLPVIATASNRDSASLYRRRTWLLRGGSAAIAMACVAVAFMLWQPIDSASALAAGGKGVVGKREAAKDISSVSGGWIVDADNSYVAFAGVHASVPFQGQFLSWDADIRLDLRDISNSSIVARIKTASATDGIPLHDETLVQTEWFNSARHPFAEFRSSRISRSNTAESEQGYLVEGMLTIKGKQLALTPLTLLIVDDRATISGQLTINRAAVDLGMESDPRGAWVSLDIRVDVTVTAVNPSLH